jgi:UDP-N-acetylglucosamine 1-carboxyvinyltransferase
LSDRFAISHDGLSPAEIVFYESSDTATINALFAASGVAGTTTLRYASANYQVQEVCGYLRALGVQIDGVGTTTLSVTGLSNINQDITYAVAEDPIDAMFFIATAASTHSALTIRRAPIQFLEVELFVLEKMGLQFRLEDAGLAKNGITKLVDIHIEPSTLIAFPEKIHPRPYPGLNIDNLPFFAVIATQAEGSTLIHDWVFEHRAIYYTELEKLGADVLLFDPHRVQITGPRHLRGAELMCPAALRPATVLLIGMLAAEGKSMLRNIYMINRGYEDLVLRLQSIGATIEATNG